MFNETTIARLLSHWQVLLEAIVRDPEQPIETLPLLTEAEREHLLLQSNATMSHAGPELCAHQLFEQQVARTPDAVAVACGEDEVLTYRELNRRANQLAHYLQQLGVGPEVLVGICLERSSELIVGVLAVLKAGGAYVPLHPTYPGERLAYLLQETHVGIVLTQQQLCEQIFNPSTGFGKDIGTRYLPEGEVYTSNHNKSSGNTLEQLWQTVTAQADQNLISTISPDNLAYIIYTSGSTGVPKGVQVTQRGLGNLGLAQAEKFVIGPGSRVLQFASLSFDASVSEILMTLLTGGSLYLAEAARIQPGKDLLKLLQEQAITCVTLPPSVLAV
ncbi:MAG: non-ribosomal peptide synthetase, partial [Chloroflexi bacterium]